MKLSAPDFSLAAGIVVFTWLLFTCIASNIREDKRLNDDGHESERSESSERSDTSKGGRVEMNVQDCFGLEMGGEMIFIERIFLAV